MTKTAPQPEAGRPQVTMFLVRIECAKGDIQQGTVTDLASRRQYPFASLAQLVLLINTLCEQAGMPAQALQADGLRPGGGQGAAPLPAEAPQDVRRPALKSFMVEVLYRQNGSLQGRVTAPPSAKLRPNTLCFRSELELMTLMQSYLEGDA